MSDANIMIKRLNDESSIWKDKPDTWWWEHVYVSKANAKKAVDTGDGEYYDDKTQSWHLQGYQKAKDIK